MTVKVIVFDFDGTLIDSNQLKYDAFFKLFPFDAPPKNIIEEVLGEFLEESRYVILREILKRVDTETINENELDNRVQELAIKYNDIVVDGTKHCKEKPGAEEVLESLSLKITHYSSLEPYLYLTKWGVLHGNILSFWYAKNSFKIF